MEFDQLRAELGAHFGVEVRERFVEKEDAWLADNGAADGDALLLSSGKIARHACEKIFNTEDGGGFLNAACDVGCREMADAKAEGEVFSDVEMRVKRIILEDHGDIAVARREVADVGVADKDFSRGETFQPCHHAQGAGLAAAGRSEENNEGLVGDLEGEVENGGDFLAAATAVDLGDVLEGDAGHGRGAWSAAEPRPVARVGG